MFMPVLNERLASDFRQVVPGVEAAGARLDPATARLVASHPALGSLPELDRHALLRWSKLRSVKRREVICEQGDPVSAVILVLEGYAKLATPLEDGDEVVLEVIGPGRCAGELTALQRRVHDASLIALSACRVLLIDARQFRQVFDRNPEGLLAIMHLANDRLQRVSEQLVDRTKRTGPVRLAKAVLQLAGLPASGAGGAAGFPLGLSQGELAAMTGTCREVVNKQLGAWRDAGYIRMSGGSVTSVDVTILARMLREEARRDGRLG
jgi:CRP-like cAMP-binding protein